MKKPLIFQMFGGYSSIEEQLNAENIPFTVQDIFSNFWGKEYTIPCPCGRGSSKKIDTVYKIFKRL